MSDVSAGELFYQKVNQAFPEAVEETVEFRGEHTLVIRQEFLKDVASLLLRDDDELRCDLLEDIVADDMLPDFPRFAVNYHIYLHSKESPYSTKSASRGS